MYKCTGYASDIHFLLGRNCTLPAGKEQRSLPHGKKAAKNERKAAGRNLPSEPRFPAPQAGGLRREHLKFCSMFFWKKMIPL